MYIQDMDGIYIPQCEEAAFFFFFLTPSSTIRAQFHH